MIFTCLLWDGAEQGRQMLLSDSFPYPGVGCHTDSKRSLLCLLIALDVRKSYVLGLLASFMAKFQSLVLSDKRFVFASSFLQRSACLLKM